MSDRVQEAIDRVTKLVQERDAHAQKDAKRESRYDRRGYDYHLAEARRHGVVAGLNLDDMLVLLSLIPRPGWKLMPVEPTPEMIAATVVETEPSYQDIIIAQSAVALLPMSEHPDMPEILAQVVLDYRTMVASAPNQGESL